MTAEQPSDPTGGPTPGSSRPSFSATPERQSTLPAELGEAHGDDGDDGGEPSAAEESSADVHAADGSAADAPASDRPRRRRGSRGGRRRRRGRPGAAPENGLEPAPASDTPEAPERIPSSALPREIGIDQIPGEDADEDAALPPQDDGAAPPDASGEPGPEGFGHKKRRRRGSRGGRNRKRRGGGEVGAPAEAGAPP